MESECSESAHQVSLPQLTSGEQECDSCGESDLSEWSETLPSPSDSSLSLSHSASLSAHFPLRVSFRETRPPGPPLPEVEESASEWQWAGSESECSLVSCPALQSASDSQSCPSLREVSPSASGGQQVDPTRSGVRSDPLTSRSASPLQPASVPVDHQPEVASASSQVVQSEAGNRKFKWSGQRAVWWGLHLSLLLSLLALMRRHLHA